ncbi:hypothetical protein FHS76_000572 [Ochrobactrum daejeonense]|uniref:Transmembrane protein n=1 Tax=Brucella daejeonensis TaxID=659015 RepID=A0A7W9AUW4_9HYPH|nr:hypothetical protein [Brucella daejeonensis]MBB5700729.1 hypothetical protein [Brucella daejeonensis]
MIGAALSRWTLSYFAASLIFLIVGVGLMVDGYGYPFHDIRAPETLIVVHVIAIGWLALLMCGALLQFVPVLVAGPLWKSEASLPTLVLLLAGLLGLLCGFAGMAGLMETPVWLLPASALLLISGFAVIVLMLAMTIWQARPITLPARFVAVGLASLMVVAVLGGIFAFVFSGLTDNDVLLNIAGMSTPLHGALGLGGWMSFTAMGVSYRLLTMFLLSPDDARKSTRILWWAGTLALTVLGAGVVLFAFGRGQMGVVLLAALIPGAVAVALYVYDMRAIYRQRRRKAIELNSAASIPAFASMTLAIVLALILPWIGTTDGIVAALVYLFTFGWLTGLSLAQLYKIVPFLTWLECYGPVMGRVPTPRVQDIVSEKQARRWFSIYFTGVAIATLALGTGYPIVFQLASAVNLCAILAIAFYLFRARRLMDVPLAVRLPKGTVIPHLIYAGGPALRRSK